MSNKEIHIVPVKWSDIPISMMIMIGLTLFAKLSFLNSLLLIIAYPVFFMLLTKRFCFYEDYFAVEGLVFGNEKKYYYKDVKKIVTQSHIYARNSISFIMKNNKRYTTHYDGEKMMSIIETLKKYGVEVRDNLYK